MRRKPNAAWSVASVATAALITFLAVLLGGAAAPAQAGLPEDAVLDWNRHATEALVNGGSATPPGIGQAPPVSILHLAMVQGAVYDAVNTIDGGHEPYLDGLPTAPASASRSAAVATAAHDVLVGLAPQVGLPDTIVNRLHDRLGESIAGAIDQDGLENALAGAAAGAAAADAMLEARETDGRYVPFSFTCGEGVGQWRPVTSLVCTTPSGPSDPFAWVGKVDPFVLQSTSQFRTKGPHEVSSRRYAREYDEVKRLGGNGTTTPTERTQEQTDLARFFSANPIGVYSSAFRTISQSEGLTLVEQARLFAMLNLAGADSLINCWDDKAHWSFWRPITAIRLGDTDGNDRTVGDANWTSYAGSPPYPDHPSGYNCVTGAFMHAAKAFFGTSRIEFDLVATITLGGNATLTRSYDRLTDVVEDTIDARMYQGIHFRAPDEQGAGIGKNVARWLASHYLEPLDDDEDDDDEEDEDDD